MGLATFALYLPLLLMNSPLAVAHDVIISTAYGDLRGSMTAGLAAPVATFLGVPFARPPTGSLRFMPPEPPINWSGVKNAVKFGPECLQNYLEGYPFYGPKNNQSEDCLYLNIYTPAINDNSTDCNTTCGTLSTNSSLPVMVWLHGGGYYVGAGSHYDMSALAAAGPVIVVTINYRLDLLGFLSTEDDAMPGNYGMLDQIMALKWVRDNIASFGGDPGRVTVFGESAGSSSISLLTLSPLAKGLFQRAILQSGVSLSFWAAHHPAEMISARMVARLVGSKAGCSNLENTTELQHCLKQVDASRLLEISHNLEKATNIWGLAKPRVETTFGFLPDLPVNLLLQGEFNDVDAIYGFNIDELGSMAILFSNQTDSEAIQEELLPIFPVLTKARLETIINSTYTDKQQDRIKRLVQIGTDSFFVGPIMFEMFQKCRQKSNSTLFLYQFDYRPSTSAIQPPWVQAVHGDEIAFLTDIRHRQPSDPAHFVPSTDDVIVSKQMIDLWTSFAASGLPTPASGDTWSPFSASSPRYLEVNVTSQVKVWARPQVAEFYRQVLRHTDRRDIPA